eukprot:TRINITY_DN2627_c0_g1_i1.p2 TRINITY_DN2627_c0_g1~~TRINITY_DN2627_c0_g1_i1.p2  ORF type:complete len:103 (-),score=19.76 TRINITY_DN2627_c0_g1_i1:177-485(-)
MGNDVVNGTSDSVGGSVVDVGNGSVGGSVGDVGNGSVGGSVGGSVANAIDELGAFDVESVPVSGSLVDMSVLVDEGVSRTDSAGILEVVPAMEVLSLLVVIF